MKITSSAFQNNKTIPSKYTCQGENLSPPLEFSNIPKNAKALVLIMDDPDAPSGTFTHWLVWNIPSKVTEIEEDERIRIKNTSKNLSSIKKNIYKST